MKCGYDGAVLLITMAGNWRHVLAERMRVQGSWCPFAIWRDAADVFIPKNSTENRGAAAPWETPGQLP